MDKEVNTKKIVGYWVQTNMYPKDHDEEWKIHKNKTHSTQEEALGTFEALKKIQYAPRIRIIKVFEDGTIAPLGSEEHMTAKEKKAMELLMQYLLEIKEKNSWSTTPEKLVKEFREHLTTKGITDVDEETIRQILDNLQLLRELGIQLEDQITTIGYGGMDFETEF